jgi:hypothetical protein
VDLDDVADELYALWPGDFTAARTAREKEARAAGDKELAAQVKALGKPTTVGWLANRLVRDHADEVQPLLELGDALREATAVLEGEELRALSQQQHQLVAALVRQARRDAAGSGHRVGEDAARGLEETLRAALADADLSAQLAGGRLTGGLQHSGFGGGGGAAPTARKVLGGGGRATPGGTSPSGSKTTAGGKAAGGGKATAGKAGGKGAADDKAAAADRARERRERAAARKQAERELADARTQAAAAAEAHADAKATVAEAAEAAGAAAARVAELRTELEKVSRDQADAERRRRAAEPEVAAATKAVKAADRLVRSRTARLEELD